MILYYDFVCRGRKILFSPSVLMLLLNRSRTFLKSYPENVPKMTHPSSLISLAHITYHRASFPPREDHLLHILEADVHKTTFHFFLAISQLANRRLVIKCARIFSTPDLAHQQFPAKYHRRRCHGFPRHT